MEMKEKILALEKLGAQFNKVLSTLAKEQGHENGEVRTDAFQTEKLEKMKADIFTEMHKMNPPKKKIIFGGEGELGENEFRKSLADFMLMAKYNHSSLEKTVMSEGDNAQGGYTVPTGLDTNIIGELNQAASIIQKCTPYIHGQMDGFNKKINKWLTDMTVYWVLEAGIKTSSKPTVAQKESVLKKICALVSFTDELLKDNTTGLAGRIQKLVGENIASELERIVLQGSTVAGDPFNGIYYAAGVNTVPQGGVSLAYSDLTSIQNNANVNDKYLVNPEWYLNKTVLGYIMDLVDTAGRPIWNMGNFAQKIPGTILGYPYNKSQHITNTLGAASNKSAIFFGDYKHVYIGQKAGDSSIELVISNSAVISTGVEVTENAFTQDETFYRFKLRRGVLVAIPESFSVGTEIG